MSTIATELTRIATGDRAAFDRLYRAQRRPLLAYALGLLAGDRAAAEDVFDEAFIDVWQQAGRFAGTGSAQGWIRRIVRNKAVDWLRKHGSNRFAEWSAADDDRADESPDAEEQLVAANTRDWLRQALTKLSFEQREAVLLCYFEERSVAEIAGIQSCPQGTVKTRLFHARLNLRGSMLEAVA
jgi:RNA polymerase sigma-70 factor, ECF subfamily